MCKHAIGAKQKFQLFVIALLLVSHLLAAQSLPFKPTQECMCDLPYTSAAEEGLKLLEARIQKELLMVNCPSRPRVAMNANDPEETLDVAIIGGGMAGMSACFALIKEGISNVRIFDENAAGSEGPWTRYARMNVLRSGKTCLGPALGIPSLTFWAWYEAQHGTESWTQLKSVPTLTWNKYLNWVREVLKLPFENNITLVKIVPIGPFLQLIFQKDGSEVVIHARKVVLATGRTGSGGAEIPTFMDNISKQLYAHTVESFDPDIFKNKRIAIVGAGASAFDAAGTALENGAASVEMLVRRSAVPLVNKFTQFYFPGLAHGFYYLPDELRCIFFAEALACGIPPPRDALERIKCYKNFNVHFNIDITSISDYGDVAVVHCGQGDFTVDLIILATGFSIDLSQRNELSHIHEEILLWKDKIPCEQLQCMPKIGLFPYLGPWFQFQEKESGTADFLNNIYCFNYGAFLSHGLLSGDIALISQGAIRLAQGIATDLFFRDIQEHLNKYRSYKAPLFHSSEYPFLSSELHHLD